MLGRAIGRQPYSRSYVFQLLHDVKPITPRVDHAARILMLGAAALDGRWLVDPMPIFEGGPIQKLQAAQEVGVSWQELYASDTGVRGFIDTLIDLITRG